MEQQNVLKESVLRFFHDLFDLTLVNCLWLVCSLPVITIGPATCGLYTVTLKLAREEAVNPLKDFFRGMWRNLKAGILLELIAAVLLALAAGDIWLALRLSGFLQILYFALTVFTAMLFLALVGYAFSLQAMFDNSLKQQVLNALKLALVSPGRTLVIWVLLLIPVVAALTMPAAVLQVVGFLYLVIGFSGPVYAASRIHRHIFDRVNGAPLGDAPPTTEK